MPKGRKRYEVIADFALQLGWRIGIEVGIYRGETISYLLNKCPNLFMWGIDHWQDAPRDHLLPKYTEAQLSTAEEEAADRLMPFKGRYQILRQDSRFAHAELYRMTVKADFVFIDADHSYFSVLEDIKNYSKFVKTGGYIMGHDIHYASVKKAVIESFPQAHLFGELDDQVWYIQKQKKG